MKTLLLALCAAGLLAACGEKPSRADPEKGHAYNRVDGPGQLTQRAQTQNEAERIGN